MNQNILPLLHYFDFLKRDHEFLLLDKLKFAVYHNNFHLHFCIIYNLNKSHKASNGTSVSYCEFGYRFSNFNNATEKFVTRHQWEHSSSERIVTVMAVCVADTTVKEFKLYIHFSSRIQICVNIFKISNF